MQRYDGIATASDKCAENRRGSPAADPIADRLKNRKREKLVQDTTSPTKHAHGIALTLFFSLSDGMQQGGSYETHRAHRVKTGLVNTAWAFAIQKKSCK